jgi:hypothetical protein
VQIPVEVIRVGDSWLVGVDSIWEETGLVLIAARRDTSIEDAFYY